MDVIFASLSKHSFCRETLFVIRVSLTVFSDIFGYFSFFAKMAYKLAMGKFSHLSKRRGRDDDDDDFDRLPRKGLDNVPPHLSIKYYRMDKVA